MYSGVFREGTGDGQFIWINVPFDNFEAKRAEFSALSPSYKLVDYESIPWTCKTKCTEHVINGNCKNN